MSAHYERDIKVFLKKHKIVIVCVLCIIIIIAIKIITTPEIVDSGNGYSHQIGSFGQCDMNFDDCTINATHRQHHFFGNEDYCESCWERYGKDMFDRLSNVKSNSDVLDYNENKCRHTGCKKRAKYSNWEHRFCSEHLQGMKYCRYPTCSEQIPIYGFSEYCAKHG